MKVGFYQFRPQFGKIAANTKKIIKALDKLDADLIVLPELALSGYYFKDAKEALSLAEDPNHSTNIDSIINLCRDNHIHIVIGFAEKAKDKCFNSSALIGPQGIIHIYRKLHLFNEEKFCMSPGDVPLKVNEVNGVKLGMMVCFDWAFPEVTRTLAMNDAEIICHPSNLVLNFCQQTMLARCLENRVFAITANRFGSDNRPHGSLRFTGKSQIVTPKGELIFQAASQREACYITEINPTESHDKFITKHNNLFSDRRPDFYEL
jgi:predicted amidohydrolase|tara:strand:+ start:83 stop:871 length:789 start_codon:yes stop_codon:yes gene_type:complete